MAASLEYGFRHDPLQFVEEDESLAGALVRWRLFDASRPDDERIIQEELHRTKAVEGRVDGPSCEGRAPVSVDPQKLLRLVKLGASADHPDVHRALALLDRLPHQPREPIGGDALEALCLLDRADHPAVRHSLRGSIATADSWIQPLSACPWTPSGALPGLWAARHLEDTAPVVERGLRAIRDQMDQTGCLGFMDPWSFVHCAATIDHPIAREILVKQIPMLLRAQRSCGAWGENTFDVLAALERHGLLDELRRKPPLPPDWSVARSIPAPEGELWGLVCDGERLWTGVRASNEALAVSPADGRLLARVELPAGHGRWLGWWDGKLAVTQGSPSKQDPKRLLQIDPQQGRVLQEVSLDKLEHVGGVVQVGAELWVFDAFFGSRYVLDAARPHSPRTTHDDGDLPCSLPITASAAGDAAVWLVDAWSPWIVKTDREGRLLDWGEKPFESHAGVAWDGEELWALDRSNRRFSTIVKQPSPQ